MPRYVVLVNWTEQGVRNAKQIIERLHASDEAVQRVGGKFLSVNYTMGRYDMVVVAEAPDDETAVAFLLEVAGRGNVRSETLKAFSPTRCKQSWTGFPADSIRLGAGRRLSRHVIDGYLIPASNFLRLKAMSWKLRGVFLFP